MLNKKRVVEIEETKFGGCKDRKGKAQLDMVPPVVLELISEALEAGETKGYDRHNWFKGISFMESYAALQRHLSAWFEGKDDYKDVTKDGKTVIGSHINAALFNLASIAIQTHYERDDLDDRWISNRESQKKPLSTFEREMQDDNFRESFEKGYKEFAR